MFPVEYHWLQVPMKKQEGTEPTILQFIVPKATNKSFHFLGQIKLCKKHQQLH